MSTPLKRGPKPKFLTEELDAFMAEAKYTKQPKGKKSQKRQQVISNTLEEDEVSEAVGHFQPNVKKTRVETEADTGNLVREKIQDIMENQISTRKQSNDQLLKSLSQVMLQIKADNDILKSNHQKLQHLSTALIKCMEQANTAQEHKLKAINEIYVSFKKQCDDIESDHKEEAKKLAEELEADIQKLQQKLVSETKRSGWETLRKTIFHAMQNDY